MEKQLDFCTLTYSDNDKDINLETTMLIKAYNFNKKFSKINIPKFNVQLIYSRKEFNKLWGSETPNFVSAFAKKNKIVIFAYGTFEKETDWEKKEFYKTLIHEINHLFYQKLRGHEYKPLWLSEGLATFMQHNKKKGNYTNKLNISKQALNQKDQQLTLESYQIFAMFVEYLILNFGEDKILELIKQLKKGENLNKLMQKIYNQSFEKLIENGNKYHSITKS